MTGHSQTLNLKPLGKAIDVFIRLHECVSDGAFMSQQDEIVQLGLESGLIQHFEFTYELCWKSIKRWLEANISPDIADGVTRRELFRLAAENRLIADAKQWMIYHAARNNTSHRYGVDMAQDLLPLLSDFGQTAVQLHQQLEQRND